MNELFQLSPENSAAENVEFIFDVLLQFLGQEHIDYAVELGMYSKFVRILKITVRKFHAFELEIYSKFVGILKIKKIPRLRSFPENWKASNG